MSSTTSMIEINNNSCFEGSSKPLCQISIHQYFNYPPSNIISSLLEHYMTLDKSIFISSEDKYLAWRLPTDKNVLTSHVSYTKTTSSISSSKPTNSTIRDDFFVPLGDELLMFATSFSKRIIYIS